MKWTLSYDVKDQSIDLGDLAYVTNTPRFEIIRIVEWHIKKRSSTFDLGYIKGIRITTPAGGLYPTSLLHHPTFVPGYVPGKANLFDGSNYGTGIEPTDFSYMFDLPTSSRYATLLKNTDFRLIKSVAVSTLPLREMLSEISYMGYDGVDFTLGNVSYLMSYYNLPSTVHSNIIQTVTKSGVWDKYGIQVMSGQYALGHYLDKFTCVC